MPLVHVLGPCVLLFGWNGTAVPPLRRLMTTLLGVVFHLVHVPFAAASTQGVGYGKTSWSSSCEV